MRTALKKDEIVLLITRQHWIRLLLPAFVWIISATLLIWLGEVIGFVITLVLALYPLHEYLNYKSNLWCVTNLRVVDESGYFRRYSKESPLEKINNVEYEQGIWGRILGFGDVDIQTAAEMGETTYEFIFHPKVLKDTITQAQEEYKKQQINSQAAQCAKAMAATHVPVPQNQQMIADELNKLFELLQKGAISQEEYIAQKRKLM